MTTDAIDLVGSDCVTNDPNDAAEVKRILASATRAVREEDAFTDSLVRAKIVEDDENGSEHLVATVEQHGAVRGEGKDRVLSKKALEDLEKSIRRACSIY